jgi:uncharacterized damage-inducible protein DinB
METTHSLAHHFRTEAFNNAWANHRLLAACMSLTPEEFRARRTSFFPSIKATLNHILTVDWYYIDMLERARDGRVPNAEAGRFFDPEEPFDACADLAREQKAADLRLVALCESLGDADMDKPVTIPRRDAPMKDRVRRILAHLFQHQIHHRGQAHAMLSGTTVKPPQLDEFYCTGEAPLRAGDFAALGFSEEAIWGSRAKAP